MLPGPFNAIACHLSLKLHTAKDILLYLIKHFLYAVYFAVHAYLLQPVFFQPI